MKKLFTLLAFAITLIATAQAPQGFNYQATVRNSSGALVINQNVLFKFNIMLNSQTSLPVYSETHQAPTDDLGQVNLTVGQGTPTTGTFSGINWGSGTYYLGIELNTGAGFVAMGTTQLLSVPYALYSNSSGSISGSNTVTPSVNTGTISNLTTYNTTLTATITNANLNQINEKGFAYSTNPNPRRSDGEYAVAVSDPFEFPINNQDFTILPNTTYYVRAYVVTENEVVVYGNQVSFSVLPIFENGAGLTDIDVNQYPSVIIDSKEWMQNNLNVSRYKNGDVIPEVTDEAQWASLTTGAWRYIANDPAYGKLYNWYAVNDPRGLAPQGWHVATTYEFTGLTNFLGGTAIAGGRLKGGTWTHQGPFNPNSGSGIESITFPNLSGFSALGGNLVGIDGSVPCASGVNYPVQIPTGPNPWDPTYTVMQFNCVNYTGSAGFWWSATSVDSTTANYIGLAIDSASATAAASDKKFGYSVRCVKN